MLEKIIIVALIVLALWSTMWEGMIFGRVNTWFANLRESLKKPLYACVICMTPWWGALIYNLLPFMPEWLIVVLCAMGINAIIVKLSCD